MFQKICFAYIFILIMVLFGNMYFMR